MFRCTFKFLSRLSHVRAIVQKDDEGKSQERDCEQAYYNVDEIGSRWSHILRS
jgi:hypothetical protein